MTNIDTNDTIDLRRLWHAICKAKFIYLASILFFVGLGIFYCFYKMPQYKTSATILIEESSSGSVPGMSGAGGMANIMKTFQVGGFSSSSVDNEILIIESHKLLSSVVKHLGLNFSYVEKDGIERKLLYNNSPIKVEVSDSMIDNLECGLKLNVKLHNGKADLKLSTGFFGMKTLYDERDVTLPVMIPSKFGDLYVMPTDYYNNDTNTNITIGISTTIGSVKALRTLLNVDFCDKLADAISLEIKYPNKKLGEDILNTIMSEYNDIRRNRRTNNASEEAEFLKARIDELLPQIITSELELAKFKRKNKFTGIEVEANSLVKAAVGGQANLIKSEFETKYYNEVLTKLKSNTNQVVPVVESLGNPMIEDYNELIIKRNEIAQEVKPGHRELQKLDDRIELMRKSLIDNVKASLDTIEVSNQAYRKLISNVERKRDQVPDAEREYEALYRDNTLKLTLYAFLVQKRENALIQAAATDTLGFIIDPAHTQEKPDYTKALIVLLACLVLSILCPTLLVILLMQIYENKIESPIDFNFDNLESATIQYTGSSYQMSALRNHINANDQLNLVLVISYSPFDETSALIGELTNSFASIDIETERITIPSNANNDYLLSSKFQASQQQAEEKAKFAFAVLPDNDNINVVSPLLNQPNVQLLYIIPTPNRISRKLIKKQIGILPFKDRITICLDKCTVE